MTKSPPKQRDDATEITFTVIPPSEGYSYSRAFLVRPGHRASVAHLENCPADGWGQFDGAAASPMGGGQYRVGPMVVTIPPFRAPPYGCSEDWRPISEAKTEGAPCP